MRERIRWRRRTHKKKVAGRNGWAGDVGGRQGVEAGWALFRWECRVEWRTRS